MSTDSISSDYTEAGSKKCDLEGNDDNPKNRM